MELDLADIGAMKHRCADGAEIARERCEAQPFKPGDPLEVEPDMRCQLVVAVAERLQPAGREDHAQADIGVEVRGDLRCRKRRLDEDVANVGAPLLVAIVLAGLVGIDAENVLAHRQPPAVGELERLVESERRLALLRKVRRFGVVAELEPGFVAPAGER